MEIVLIQIKELISMVYISCTCILFIFTVFPGEEVLVHVKVAEIRHSIMTCRITCTAVQRSMVVLQFKLRIL